MEMLEGLLNHKVVLDMSSPYVCMGKLIRASEHYYELEDADIHDLRDTPTTRENYVVATKLSGIKPNRKHVFIRAAEVVAVALFKNVVVTD
jgi:hypothetical protein